LFFYWFGTVLSEIFRDFKRAREMFSIGRDASRDPLNSLGLAGACMDQRDVGGGSDAADTGAEAWSELKRAEHLITEDETWGRDPYVLRLLAEAQIRLGELDAAEANLRVAEATDTVSAKIAADFGLIWMAREDYARARTSFQAAVLRNPRSLAIRTNLAQAYFKANVLSSAENEYKQLVTMTGEHIEAWLGLGDVYTAMADRGDTERYADAVVHYSRGISLATGQAGQQVSNTKLSEAYYALGYVHVKISETSRDVSGKSEWIEARNAFRSCRALDPDNYKAQRAIDKIDKHSSVLASPRWIDAVTSGVIVALALFVFAVAQIGLLRGQPITGKAADAPYVVLSLGSILLAIAGFYLPRVLKLKFGSLELEKSPADQVTTPTALGIRL
ncbi:MAG TPA: tetratricopeptide repeat protein, partial [Xanthomonadales bacterium]|nr:tetratricopeptide repeat protein [Xanthomonadales bacterium]